MRVEEMPAAVHDRVLALVSHLPHVVAYALVNAVAGAERDGGRRVLAYAAGGFRDTTRIARSPPEMWRDICLANRHELLRALDRFTTTFDRLRDAIAIGDGPAIAAELARAQAVRRRLAVSAIRPPRLVAARGRARRSRGR